MQKRRHDGTGGCWEYVHTDINEGKSRMNKALEYTKKLVLLRYLYRKNLLSNKEYEQAKSIIREQNFSTSIKDNNLFAG